MSDGVAAGREPWSPAALRDLRRQFPILETTTYLINNSLGAMPARVERDLGSYAQEWMTRGVRAWEEGWWELPIEIGDLVAPLLGVPAGTVSMHHNVTIATAILLSCLHYERDRARLVYTEHDFPSLAYLIAGEQQRGAEIVVVPARDGIGIELEDLLAAIDERTSIVCTSHVLFKSSFVQDAQAIAQRCRDVGALLLLDVYQSAGVLPLELERWGVDAAVGGCLKWLCGGPGNAFLYVGRAALRSPRAPPDRLAVGSAAVRIPARPRTGADRRSTLLDRNAERAGAVRGACRARDPRRPADGSASSAVPRPHLGVDRAHTTSSASTS